MDDTVPVGRYLYEVALRLRVREAIKLNIEDEEAVSLVLDKWEGGCSVSTAAEAVRSLLAKGGK